MHSLSAITLALLLGAPGAGSPARPFFLGQWEIAKATPAPWGSAGERARDEPESKSLLGKKLVFEEARIRGPGLLACKSLHYSLTESVPQTLFQGAFEELQRKDASVDPARLAASLGFQGSKFRTLETGCANELDFHFVDDTTAEFGLNSFVYTIRRPATPATQSARAAQGAPRSETHSFKLTANVTYRCYGGTGETKAKDSRTGVVCDGRLIKGPCSIKRCR